jgi:hypothetical protein
MTASIFGPAPAATGKSVFWATHRFYSQTTFSYVAHENYTGIRHWVPACLWSACV